VLANLGKYAEEVKCYDKAIKINPKDAEAWFNKGAALANLGKYAEEVKCYDKAIKINPNYDKAWYNKGVTLRNLGKYAEAVKCYDNAIKIKPNYDKAWFNKGVSLDDLGKYDEAVKCYDNAIKINPDDAEAYFNKGIAFLNARKYNEAEDELATAKELLSNRDMKNDAQKARQYQLLAIGASKLMSKMTPLDQRFMRCLASRSLREVKEKAMGICKSIQRIIKESKKVRMPLDVKDLLDSKRICFTALSAALHFRNVNLKELNRAKRVFEKWKLDEFAASTDFLKSFVKRLRKYASLQDIPKTTQQVLLRVLAGSLYVLNGDLTAEITRKIKGKAFPLKAIERRIESEVEIQSFEVADPEKEWVKVCLVQLDFALTESFPYRLKEAQKGRIKKKVFTALEIAKKERVNIIAFPELSFAKEWAKEIKDKYKDIMIVCGSSYDKYDRNVCEIIIDGKSCSYAKCHCSIMEEGNGGGLKQGNKALVLKTRYGIISVLTCIDFDYEYNRISKYVNDRYGNPLDLIINPRFDVDNDYTFQVNSSLAMALPDGSRNHTFILHINGKNVEWGKKKGGGGTAIICNEHGHRIEKYIRDGIRPQDKIDYKIYEARNEMMLIANLRIKPTTQRRTKTGNWYRYDGRNWRVLKNKSIWQYKKIP